MADYFRDLIAVGPELILCGTLLVVLMVDLWRVGRDRAIVWWIALIVTFLSCLAMVQIGSLYHQAEAKVDGMALLPEFIGHPFLMRPASRRHLIFKYLFSLRKF